MTVLVVGASYSADDIACQLVTLGGAEKVLVSHRKPEPLGYKWPAGVEERKEVRHFSEDSVTFKDGATDTIDAVILATGYIHHYPFMQVNIIDVNKVRMQLKTGDAFRMPFASGPRTCSSSRISTRASCTCRAAAESSSTWACKTRSTLRRCSTFRQSGS